MNLIEELRWRGMVQDIIPETEEFLLKNKTAGYIGFDPTADSLHVGSFQQIMLLMHLQRAGHQPIALVGGATGMVGDPSGKSAERQLLTLEEINHNISCIKNQLSKFIDFSEGNTGAKLVNNYDWFKEFSFLGFIRDVGKHISVNYMMSKDSVQNRLETGISYTEFTYQLLQGYDFLHLYKHHNCKLQIGGSDQWGNITTGTELIRRMEAGKAYAFTSPLVTKADGTKFGKSEGGENVWLDKAKTSPYKFYQFWLNRTDEEVVSLVKRFTFKTEEATNALIAEHLAAPHLRILQKELSSFLTTLVHSEEDYKQAVSASDILFGNAAVEQLQTISVAQLLDVFEGVPTYTIAKSELETGIDILSFLAEKTKIFSSKSEARRAISENAVSINKQKISLETVVSTRHLIQEKLILVQHGKKKYFLAEVA